MSVNKKGSAVSRRGFLKGVAVAGGAAAASAVVTEAANAGIATSPVDEKAQQDAKGYHVTPHILEYYEKARF